MDHTVKTRNQVADKYKWDISAIFENDAAFEQAFERFDKEMETLAKYVGTLGEGASKVNAFFDEKFAVERKLYNLYTYAFLRKTEDNRQEAAQSMMSRVESKLASYGAAVSFAEPELLALPTEVLDGYLNAKDLEEYHFELADLVREKDHMLSEKEEKILAGMSELADSPKKISRMLMDADMTFGSIQGEDGKEVPVTGSNYILLQNSKDRRVRKDSFDSFYKGFKDHINTFTATYAANVKKDVFLARTRNYNGAREMAMSGENIPAYVYDNLIETIHKHMPTMHRYVELRKKILGVEQLHYYDVYTPLAADIDLSYTYEEAEEMVLKAVAPLGEDYVKILKEGYAKHWVDAMPNEGKSSGAYSSGTYDSNPYIMMNYTGTLDSVSTLAHESGHSMHSYFSGKNQPFHLSEYKIFVAEVASTVNENLLIEQLLKEEITPQVRMYLLNQYLENFKSTVYRQTMFAEFEKIAHEMEERGEALSTKALCDLYKDLIKQYFGEALVIDEEVQYEWARIPHFYRSFYVYKYATGYSSAVSLSEAILKEGKPAVDKYLEFLSLGGSKYPLDSLKHGGVDLTTPAPVDAALDKFERILQQAEACYEELKK